MLPIVPDQKNVRKTGRRGICKTDRFMVHFIHSRTCAHSIEVTLLKIGIPRAFLYYRYHTLWETFFEELGVDFIVSPPTNKAILDAGSVCAIDEACLSMKIFLGHVDWLIGRCDKIFLPRAASMGRQGSVCMRLQAGYDVAANTFRDRGVELLDFDIDLRKNGGELENFLSLGRAAGKKKAQTLHAYLTARQADKAVATSELLHQRDMLQDRRCKILVVGHHYNVYDPYVGGPVLDCLRALGTVPILADIVDRREALEHCETISSTLPWAFNRELVGAIDIYRRYVDGIVLMSTFPCGPDSLVNEIVLRRVRGLPVLNLLIDGQEGTAGLETRLESFVDIIHFKREEDITLA